MLITLSFLLLSTTVALADDAGHKLPLVAGGADRTCQVRIADEWDGGLTLELDVPYFEQEIIEKDGEIFHKLSLPGGSLQGQPGQAGLPAMSQLVALPDRVGVQARVIARETTRLTGLKLHPLQPQAAEGFVVDTEYYLGGQPSQIAAKAGEPALMHGLRVAAIQFDPVAYDPVSGDLEVATRLTVEVTFAGSDTRNTSSGAAPRIIPESFARLYEETVIGFERDEDTIIAPGTYILICPNNAAVVAAVEPLADWRRRQGYNVMVVTTATTGSSNSAIKSWLQTQYNTLDIPLEFVCLVGDATGGVSLPTWNENYSWYHGEGDHEYSLLHGGDPLSDVHIGRLSVDSITQLGTVVDKILDYETDPHLSSDQEWFTRAGLTGDPSSSGYSVIWVSQWVKHQLLELNYTQVDTIWSGNFQTQMMATVNQGESIFTYRGYWYMSGLNASHIMAMSNQRKLAFAVIMTCDTGSFQDDGNSRSEAFLRAANGGGIAAIGTATTGTHTRYNNCMFQGVLEGCLNSGDNRAGPALTRGKLSMYENYQLSEPDNVVVWSTWNNLMGDPATSIYTALPRDLTVDHPAMISTGTNAVPVRVTHQGVPVESALVAVYKEGEVQASMYTDASGEVLLPVGSPLAGEIQLTVTGRNLRPYLSAVNVGTMDLSLDFDSLIVHDDGSGLSLGNGDGLANPGETLELEIQIRNNGTSGAADAVAELVSDLSWLTIVEATQSFGYIAAGGSAVNQANFVVEIDPYAPGGSAVPFRLEAAAGGSTTTSLVSMALHGPALAPVGTSFGGPGGTPDPGESGTVTITVDNVGDLAMQSGTAALTSLSPWVTVTDPDGSFATINPGGRGSNGSDPFSISIDADCYPGHLATLEVDVTFASGAKTRIPVQMVIGTAQSTDPVGPDSYGYYGFDNTDVGYPQAPTYEWIEIDPQLGGAGTSVGLTDYNRYQDDTEILDLPFTFPYYGQPFDKISVCSNGWISMGGTYLRHYRNWTIPSPGAPDNMIAVFWDDLYQQSGVGGVLYWDDAANHRFIVEWSRVRNYVSGATETFQVILYDPEFHPTSTGDGLIVMQYHTVNQVDSENGFATVGIQNEDRDDGVLYTYWNQYPGGGATLAAGRAIAYQTMVLAATGILKGEVTNASNGDTPIPGATVTLIDADRSLQTTEDGRYQGNVPAGEFSVAVYHESFRPDTTDVVLIIEGEETVLDFSLEDIGGPDFIDTTVYPNGEDTVGPYVIESTITDHTGVADMRFYFTSSASGGPFELPLTVVDADAGLVRAEIPGQPLGTRVQYWLTAVDVLGNTSAEPAGAPWTNYTFAITGSSQQVVVADMEAGDGWTVNDGSDTASGGIWERGDPNGVWDSSILVQPEYDHTPTPGTDCWVTGNDPPGSPPGTDDVDGGKTTLLSPLFDLSGNTSVTAEYYRWYSNDTGSAPGEDSWQVAVTDGGDWVTLENTPVSLRNWSHQSFFLDDLIDLTSMVQFRFVAEDAGSGSIVEAALDDFSLTGLSLPPDLEDPTVTVTVPNGGETFVSGEDAVISWNAADDIGVVHAEVLLSTDGGANFDEIIAAGPLNGSYTWAVPTLNSATCRVRVVCYDGVQNVASDDSDADFTVNPTVSAGEVPVHRLALAQNVPNPFNPKTEIRFTLPGDEAVSLRIYDIEGKLVRTLVSGRLPAGQHSLVWSGQDDRGAQVASGLYFYRLATDGRQLTRKMLLLK